MIEFLLHGVEGDERAPSKPHHQVVLDEAHGRDAVVITCVPASLFLFERGLDAAD